MDTLTPTQFKQLHTALLHTFPTRDQLTKMVRLGLAQNLEAIAGGATLDDFIFNLIRWAESHGQLQELVGGAMSMNPNSLALKDFAGTIAGEIIVAPEEASADATQHLPESPISSPSFDQSSHESVPSVDIPPMPFTYGAPVRPDSFIGRRKEMRRIIGRIVNNGESTALIGEPHIGKSSLLHYLRDERLRPSLYGTHAEQLCFSFLDGHALAGVQQLAEFWQRAFAPLGQLPQHQAALQACAVQGYNESGLESVVQHLLKAGQRLVLLIDELDFLLHHPVLNSAAFFGGLRAVASLSQGALAVVIASRLPLAQLNAKTQAINPSGSPFFNIYSEITLSAFNDKEMAQLLDRAKETFRKKDRLLLRQLTGGHPFLLQAASAALWDAYEDEIDDPSERHAIMLERLHKELQYHFVDTWQNWSPEFRQAYMTVALIHLKEKVDGEDFQVDEFLADLPNWEPELKELAYVGFIKRSKASGGWDINQTITLAWFVDELTKASRSESDFARWLVESELERRWTQGQREKLRIAGQAMKNLTDDLLVALVQDFGEG
ncbi:MAG: effector-associated domain EAD1-containing protein [Chloroflexota bacterium]